jgi:uncharacterized protein YndB with AHSA1/START domain
MRAILRNFGRAAVAVVVAITCDAAHAAGTAPGPIELGGENRKGAEMGRVIRKEVIVRAPVAEVWRTWTTSEGAATFFAPKAKIELAVGGAYELYFVPDAPEGSQGSEGIKILSYLPGEMLTFDWNAPPQFAEERKARTWVVVQLARIDGDSTRVTLTHLGWKDGGRWSEVYDYFDRAWATVLARLRHRFQAGPIDWKNPYRPPEATPGGEKESGASARQ